MKRLAGMTSPSRSGVQDSVIALLPPAIVHLRWCSGRLPGTRSARKGAGGLCTRNLGILRCLNDTINFLLLSGRKPSPVKRACTCAESGALENTATEPRAGQSCSWQWCVRQGVGDHGPDFVQALLGHPGSTEQAAKR